MAGAANSERSRRATGWLGLLVLLGVLTMMLVIGLIVYAAAADVWRAAADCCCRWSTGW